MKTINGLMKHMRAKGIQISGSKQKNQLRNLGYYHGYKGYRYVHPSMSAPFNDFQDLVKTIDYDSSLKELLLPKLIFIETAIRNITLEAIMNKTGSDSFNAFFDEAVTGYRDFPNPVTRNQKAAARQAQQRKNKLRSELINKVAQAYEKKNRKVSHYYESARHSYVPLWAVFEICMMGELDFIVQSLKLDYRREISDELGMNYSFDTNLMVVSDAINMLRYLRNACAHNDVVYDSRFAGRDASSEIKNLLVHELGIAAPTFKRITDFVALIAILLRKLGSSKTEVRSFLNRFMRISEAFESSIPPRIATIVLPGSWKSEIQSISSGI